MAISQDNLARLLKAVEQLAGKRVLVGVPADTTAREPEPGEPRPPNNATIGFVQEFGDKAHRIPARAFLLPGIRNARDDIVKQLKAGAVKALTLSEGAHDGAAIANAALGAAGMVARNHVVQKITDGPFVPLSEFTVKERARRGRKGALKELRTRQKLAGNDTAAEREKLNLTQTVDNVRPLNDTGQLRASINYAVVDK